MFSRSGQKRGRNLHGFLDAMVVFCGRVCSEARACVCTFVLWRGTKTARQKEILRGQCAARVPLSSPESLRNIRFPSGGCAFCGHHSRAQSQWIWPEPDSGLRAFGCRTSMVSVPMPIPRLFRRKRISFFPPSPPTIYQIKCNIL